MYFAKCILPLVVLCFLQAVYARNIEFTDQVEEFPAKDNEEGAGSGHGGVEVENSRSAKQFGFGFGGFDGGYGGGYGGGHHHHGGHGDYGGYGGFDGGYGGGYGHGGYGGGYGHGGHGGYGGYGGYNDYGHGHHHHHGYGRGLQPRFGNDIPQYYPPGPSYAFAPPPGTPMVPFPGSFKRPIMNDAQIPVTAIIPKSHQKSTEGIQTHPVEHKNKQHPVEKEVELLTPVKHDDEKVDDEKPVKNDEKKGCTCREKTEEKDTPIKKN